MNTCKRQIQLSIFRSILPFPIPTVRKSSFEIHSRLILSFVAEVLPLLFGLFESEWWGGEGCGCGLEEELRIELRLRLLVEGRE